MKRLSGMLAGIALLASCGAGQAVTLGGQNWTTSTATPLSLDNFVPAGNQPQNNPCLICGDNQPQQPANFGYNNFGNTGNVHDYFMFSTAVVGGSLANDVVGTGYNIGLGAAFLLALNGHTDFQVGIDVNQANGAGAQVLESFYFLNLTQHTVLASYIGPTPINATNNGTGFPDYTLSGFDLDRGDIALGDTIIFFARWSNATDGPDSFFLFAAPQAAETPLPAAVWMFGGVLGIAGMIAGKRRRRRSVWDETKTA